MAQQGSRGVFQVGALLLNKSAMVMTGSGAPSNGVTGAGKAGPGSLYIRTGTGAIYANTNTKASPTWTQLGTVAALASAHIFVGSAGGAATDVAMSGDVTIDNTGATTIGANKVDAGKLGTVAGTNTASKALVGNAAKSLDVLQATTALSVGGTGVPGAASVQTAVTKAVTAFSDTVAKAIFTVTIPNAKHSAFIEVDVLAQMGAGGTIGAGESIISTKYLVGIVRTAGVNAVAGVSAAIIAVATDVAGADGLTSAVITTGAVVGAVGASNTIDIQLAITKTGGASDNHTATVAARVLNANATGITIA